MATLNDYKLLQISWVFDVNFSPTFGAVYERRYVQKIAATLVEWRGSRQLVETVLAYLRERQARTKAVHRKTNYERGQLP